MFCLEPTGKLAIWSAHRFERTILLQHANMMCAEVLAFYHSWKYKVEELIAGSCPGNYPIIEVTGMYIAPLKLIYEDDPDSVKAHSDTERKYYSKLHSKWQCHVLDLAKQHDT